MSHAAHAQRTTVAISAKRSYTNHWDTGKGLAGQLDGLFQLLGKHPVMSAGAGRILGELGVNPNPGTAEAAANTVYAGA